MFAIPVMKNTIIGIRTTLNEGKNTLIISDNGSANK